LRLAALPAGHWRIAEAQSALGAFLLEANRLAQAEPLLVVSHSALREKFGSNDPRTREASNRLALLYDKLGKPELASQPSTAEQ
jgi:hypothetical protein